jgi:hypothetical protein
MVFRYLRPGEQVGRVGEAAVEAAAAVEEAAELLLEELVQAAAGETA